MILLWVMSFLLYLAWTVAQLESVLALEIQSQAIQVRYQSEFEKAEALLAHCEDRLKRLFIYESDSVEMDFNSLDLVGCRPKLIGNSGNPVIPKLNNPQMTNVRWIEMEVGQGIRLRGVFRYQITIQQLSR
ncbi:MAG: hypothetical protein EBY69_08170, partial [Burkholderiaceae bacterium]|nr:hypothetical protein [Burkholderiaceae bacterium]